MKKSRNYSDPTLDLRNKDNILLNDYKEDNMKFKEVDNEIIEEQNYSNKSDEEDYVPTIYGDPEALEKLKQEMKGEFQTERPKNEINNINTEQLIDDLLIVKKKLYPGGTSSYPMSAMSTRKILKNLEKSYSKRSELDKFQRMIQSEEFKNLPFFKNENGLYEELENEERLVSNLGINAFYVLQNKKILDAQVMQKFQDAKENISPLKVGSYLEKRNNIIAKHKKMVEEFNNNPSKFLEVELSTPRGEDNAASTSINELADALAKSHYKRDTRPYFSDTQVIPCITPVVETYSVGEDKWAFNPIRSVPNSPDMLGRSFHANFKGNMPDTDFLIYFGAFGTEKQTTTINEILRDYTDDSGNPRDFFNRFHELLYNFSTNHANMTNHDLIKDCKAFFNTDEEVHHCREIIYGNPSTGRVSKYFEDSMASLGYWYSGPKIKIPMDPSKFLSYRIGGEDSTGEYIVTVNTNSKGTPTSIDKRSETVVSELLTLLTHVQKVKKLYHSFMERRAKNSYNMKNFIDFVLDKDLNLYNEIKSLFEFVKVSLKLEPRKDSKSARIFNPTFISGYMLFQFGTNNFFNSANIKNANSSNTRNLLGVSTNGGSYGKVMTDMLSHDGWCHYSDNIWETTNGIYTSVDISKCDSNHDKYSLAIPNFFIGRQLFENEDLAVWELFTYIAYVECNLKKGLVSFDNRNPIVFPTPWLPSGVAGTAYYNHMLTGFFMDVLYKMKLTLTNNGEISDATKRVSNWFGIMPRVESIVDSRNLTVGNIYPMDLLAKSCLVISTAPSLLVLPIQEESRLYRSLCFSNKNASQIRSTFVSTFLSYIKGRSAYNEGGAFYKDLGENLFGYVVHLGYELKRVFVENKTEEYINDILEALQESNISVSSIVSELSDISPSGFKSLWRKIMGSLVPYPEKFFFERYSDLAISGLENVLPLIYSSSKLMYLFNGERLLKKLESNLRNEFDNATKKYINIEIRRRTSVDNSVNRRHLLDSYYESPTVIRLGNHFLQRAEDFQKANFCMEDFQRYIRYSYFKNKNKNPSFKLTLPNLVNSIGVYFESIRPIKALEGRKHLEYLSEKVSTLLNFFFNSITLSRTIANSIAKIGKQFYSKPDKMDVIQRTLKEGDFRVDYVRDFSNNEWQSVMTKYPYKKVFSEIDLIDSVQEGLGKYIVDGVIGEDSLLVVEINNHRVKAKSRDVLVFCARSLQRTHNYLNFNTIYRELRLRGLEMLTMSDFTNIAKNYHPSSAALSQLPLFLRDYFDDKQLFDRFVTPGYSNHLAVSKSAMEDENETFNVLNKFFNLAPSPDLISSFNSKTSNNGKYIFNRYTTLVWAFYKKESRLAYKSTSMASFFNLLMGLLAMGPSYLQLISWKLFIYVASKQPSDLSDDPNIIESKNYLAALCDIKNFEKLGYDLSVRIDGILEAKFKAVPYKEFINHVKEDAFKVSEDVGNEHVVGSATTFKKESDDVELTNIQGSGCNIKYSRSTQDGHVYKKFKDGSSVGEIVSKSKCVVCAIITNEEIDFECLHLASCCHSRMVDYDGWMSNFPDFQSIRGGLYGKYRLYIPSPSLVQPVVTPKGCVPHLLYQRGLFFLTPDNNQKYRQDMYAVDGEEVVSYKLYSIYKDISRVCPIPLDTAEIVKWITPLVFVGVPNSLLVLQNEESEVADGFGIIVSPQLEEKIYNICQGVNEIYSEFKGFTGESLWLLSELYKMLLEAKILLSSISVSK